MDVEVSTIMVRNRYEWRLVCSRQQKAHLGIQQNTMPIPEVLFVYLQLYWNIVEYDARGHLVV